QRSGSASSAACAPIVTTDSTAPIARAHRSVRTARLPTRTIRGIPAHDNAIEPATVKCLGQISHATTAAGQQRGGPWLPKSDGTDVQVQLRWWFGSKTNPPRSDGQKAQSFQSTARAGWRRFSLAVHSFALSGSIVPTL